MDREKILNYLKANKNEFIQKYGIEKLALFGSFARGENRKDSDIDIIYSLKDGVKMNFDNYLNFEDRLKKAFKRKVDLINEKRVNPLIKITALKEFIYV